MIPRAAPAPSRVASIATSIATACTFAVLIGLAACEPAVPPADLVITNARVVTLDDTHPEAQAVAVTGNIVTAVGSIAEIERYVSDGTEVVDAGGQLLIPGFIETHGHFMSLGESKTILDLTEVTGWDEIVAMVAEAAGSQPAGSWIAGRGWHQEKWTRMPEQVVDGVPLHAELSAVSPDHPVLLTHASGHAAFANAVALERAGIGSATPDPPGGTIVRGPRGQPTGLLRETAQRLVGAVRSADDAERSEDERRAERERWVELAGQESLENGVTTFHDAGADFATIDLYRSLEARGALPVRLHVMVRRESNEAMAERLGEVRTVATGNGHLTVRAIKRQIDGALGSHGAWLLDPYEDLPGSAGLVLETVEDIAGTAELALAHGYQLNTHAIGDRANREVLDLYEAAFAAAGVTNPADLRWRIEHAQHLHPDDIERFSRLGVIASMQGIHQASDAPWVFRRLGAERAESGAYLWRSLIDAGVVVTNGTDVPVEDIDPLASFHASVTRLSTEGEPFFPDQAMTRDEALRSYTINGAFAGFDEDRTGSIEPGKLADLVLLSEDILTVAPERIRNAQVQMTVVGGDIRYQREGS